MVFTQRVEETSLLLDFLITIPTTWNVFTLYKFQKEKLFNSILIRKCCCMSCA